MENYGRKLKIFSQQVIAQAIMMKNMWKSDSI